MGGQQLGSSDGGAIQGEQRWESNEWGSCGWKAMGRSISSRAMMRKQFRASSAVREVAGGHLLGSGSSSSRAVMGEQFWESGGGIAMMHELWQESSGWTAAAGEQRDRSNCRRPAPGEQRWGEQ